MTTGADGQDTAPSPYDSTLVAVTEALLLSAVVTGVAAVVTLVVLPPGPALAVGYLLAVATVVLLVFLWVLRSRVSDLRKAIERGPGEPVDG